MTTGLASFLRKASINTDNSINTKIFVLVSVFCFPELLTSDLACSNFHHQSTKDIFHEDIHLGDQL